MANGLYTKVAIPLGQGQVFNNLSGQDQIDCYVAIPLGQGQVFNATDEETHTVWVSQSLWVRDRFLMDNFMLHTVFGVSQSLWVRDRFLIGYPSLGKLRRRVAIPLGQGQVFN